ncbi:MAG TPA: ATP-binding protein [Polyangiaceae bacterium]|nr:ATP-binding protein [Polyangiaceae bacterium]
MTWHVLVGAMACAGHLAFALVLWLRRDRTNIALPLSLLFLDTFVWTFADLTYSLTRVAVWHWLDHAFSTWLPVLCVEVIAAFVGQGRALGPYRPLLYGATLVALAATPSSYWWWRAVLIHGVSCAIACQVLLARHLRASSDPAERGRTRVLIWAVLCGTLLTITDLMPDVWGLPKVSNIGMLVTLTLVAGCVLRLQLLGHDVPRLVVVYSLLGAILLSMAAFALVRALPAQGALLTLAGCSLLAIGVSTAHEVLRARQREREQVEKLVALGRFSEQLAHDLRNPLAALKGAIQFLLIEREKGRSLDDQQPFLLLMLEQVERTSSVVEAYQRIAKVEPIRVATSINQLVEGVLALQRFASTPRVSVRAALEPGLPDCEVDAALLETSLENLLRNAFDAMPEGGAISIETQAEVGSSGAPGVALIVRDQGHGMDARVLERATDQFFTTKATGSGLGLSFVARVARAHQGRLELSSQVGTGTTVRLWMPLRTLC